MYRQRGNGGADDRFVVALEGDDFLRPELSQQTYLLLDAAAAVGEGLAETVVLHVVPADADPETQLSAAEDVDLRRLLGDQCGLALREDQHAGEQLELGQGRDEPEQDKRLVEGGLVVVDVLPARGARKRLQGRTLGMRRGIGAQDVIQRQDVVEAEVAHGLDERADLPCIRRNLGRREGGADPDIKRFRHPARPYLVGSLRVSARPLTPWTDRS